MGSKNKKLKAAKQGWLAAFGLGLVLTACGEIGHNLSGSRANVCLPQVGAGSNSQGLALAAVSNNYQSSTIYFLDFETGCLREVLTGQSGDPMLRYHNGNLHLFNRESDDFNILRLELQNGTFLHDVQTANPLPGYGDPADVIFWNDDQLLLAARSQQTIGRMDFPGGELLQKLDTSSWDTKGQDFYPNFMFHKETSLGSLVFVGHSYYAYTGDEQLFVLSAEEDGSLLPLDLNPAQDLVQGLKPHFNNPSLALFPHAERPLIISVCTSWDGPDCRGGAELFDPEAMKFTRLFDFKQLELSAQFHAIEAGDEYAFFLRVSDKAESIRQIYYIDPVLPNIQIKHELSPSSVGETAMFYDKDSGVFIVGEGYAGDRGKLLFYLPDGQRLEMELVGMPYSGAFIPKNE